MKSKTEKPTGKLIVIEGSDGSGKTTQLNLLKGYLQTKGKVVETIDFPRYMLSFHGKTIARFLQGEFGDPATANPYIISVAYAADRENAAPEMRRWLSSGKVVLSNRYAPSNLAHQSGKLTPKKRDEFIKWDLELEYEINKIPKENVVIYLHVPFEVSVKLMKNKDRKTREYIKGKKDKVEGNLTYLKNSEKAYNYLLKKFPHWVKVECTKKGVMRSREEIHEEVIKLLKERKIIS